MNFAGCRWDPHGNSCAGDDDSHRNPTQDWRNGLSVVDAAAPEDIWYVWMQSALYIHAALDRPLSDCRYSTLEAGHCKHHATGGSHEIPWYQF